MHLRLKARASSPLHSLPVPRIPFRETSLFCGTGGDAECNKELTRLFPRSPPTLRSTDSGDGGSTGTGGEYGIGTDQGRGHAGDYADDGVTGMSDVLDNAAPAPSAFGAPSCASAAWRQLAAEVRSEMQVR
jgi:hypothetical protein